VSMKPQFTRAELQKKLGVKSAIEVYKITREYIQHEDGLVNQRMSWFINLNSFLFLALGPIFAAIVALLKSECYGEQIRACDLPLFFTYSNHIYVFLLMYGLVGAITSAVTFASVNAAYSAIDALEDFWRLSYEVTIYGGPEPVPHRLKREDRAVYDRIRDLWKLNFPFLGEPTRFRPFDPAVGLPYITGGGPERQSKAKGKWIPRSLIGCIGAFWVFLSAICFFSLIGLISVF
jgi:hypothetical protein